MAPAEKSAPATSEPARFSVIIVQYATSLDEEIHEAFSFKFRSDRSTSFGRANS
jgi:hypothetical protein